MIAEDCVQTSQTTKNNILVPRDKRKRVLGYGTVGVAIFLTTEFAATKGPSV